MHSVRLARTPGVRLQAVVSTEIGNYFYKLAEKEHATVSAVLRKHLEEYYEKEIKRPKKAN